MNDTEQNGDPILRGHLGRVNAPQGFEEAVLQRIAVADLPQASAPASMESAILTTIRRMARQRAMTIVVAAIAVIGIVGGIAYRTTSADRQTMPAPRAVTAPSATIPGTANQPAVAPEVTPTSVGAEQVPATIGGVAAKTTVDTRSKKLSRTKRARPETIRGVAGH